MRRRKAGGSERPDFLILAATEDELQPFLNDVEALTEVPGWAFDGLWTGRRRGLHLRFGVTGVGKANAAGAAASLMERCDPVRICLVGIGGAYREGPARPGDVVVSTSVMLGDEGVRERKESLGMEAVGFPVVSKGGIVVYSRIDLDSSRLLRWARRTTPPGLYTAPERSQGEAERFNLHFGPTVTVGLVSGDESVASRRFMYYDAWTEDMEGSAVVQMGLRYGVPVLQCRGVSNVAGVRDKNRWKTREALAHCSAVVIRWLDALAEECAASET